MKFLQNSLDSTPRIILMILLVFPLLYSPALGQAIDWKTYGAGIREARQENKKIFLHFMTQWCGYCKKMNATTFKDEEVIAFLNRHFVSIKVDGDREKAITEKYRVTGFPDSRFLDSDMNPAYKLPGFVDPLAFKFFMDYIQTESYKTMAPMEYYKSKQE
ncbi:thioredoxin family protein [Desulfospira joergensenii]|uniref:thioredoxin family protein n=1 Tax=Desulfospira joergensenii TaxID=53329 RepID=UPI0003B652B4|nr:DUF255 domain-containing protein [Desulfospira joergensenii]